MVTDLWHGKSCAWLTDDIPKENSDRSPKSSLRFINIQIIRYINVS